MEKQNQKAEDMTMNQDMLSGMFHDRESTENAYKTLQEKGYTKDEINLVMSGETLKKQFTGDIKRTDFGRYNPANGGKESADDNTNGVIAGVIASNGRSVVVRGLVINLVGPIASGVSGSGASGIPGGIVGALLDSGFSKASANLYEAGIKKGNIIIGVQLRSEDDNEFLQTNWHTNKAEEIYN